MCNRYGYQHPFARIGEAFSDLGPIRHFGDPPNESMDEIRPTDLAPVVLPAKDGDGVVVARLRWGLVPWFHKGPMKDFKGLNTNARSETVATLASFKETYGRRRCLVPATHYFEWT